jgi:uncharacterized protein YbcI
VLARNGSHTDISDFRQVLRQMLEDNFRAAIERLTGRRVIAFLGASHLAPDVAPEIFVLDKPV